MRLLLDSLGGITNVTNKEFWSGERLAEEVTSRAKVLARVGTGRGDRILILHGGSPAFFADLLAVWSVGACAVCLNPALTAAEQKNITNLLKPAAALVAKNDGYLGGKNDVSVHNFTENLPRIDGEMVNQESSLDDNALILFTSGTTGVPKGVVHTFRSLFARISLNRSKISSEALAVTLSPLPTHFGHGLIGNSLTALLGGGDLILAQGSDFRVLAQLGKLIDEHQVSFMSSVPAMWKLVVNTAKRPTGDSLRRIHVGSAPFSADLWNQVIDWSGISDVVNMYGITETANWIGGASASEMLPRDGLIGRVWGGTAAVMGEDGVILSEGHGELLVQTPSLMAGYFQHDELTQEVLRDGWFYTGDVGTLSADGVMCLTGRKKFEINRAGLKVHPEDIDILLERHFLIQEACAFGVPDELAGEIVAVAVVVVNGQSIDIDAMKEWCSESLVKEKIPELWFVLDEIPKTDRGKINRDTVAKACLENIGKR